MAQYRNRQFVDDAGSDSSMDSLDRKILGLPSKSPAFELQPPSPSPAPRFEPQRSIRRPMPASAAPQFPPLPSQRRSIYDVPKMQALLARQAAAYAAVQENERRFMAESYIKTTRYTNTHADENEHAPREPPHTFRNANTYKQSALEQEASIMNTPERRPTNGRMETYKEDNSVEQREPIIRIPEARRTISSTEPYTYTENIVGQGESRRVAGNYHTTIKDNTYTEDSHFEQDDSIMRASEPYHVKQNMDIYTENSIVKTQEQSRPTKKSAHGDHNILREDSTLQPLTTEPEGTMKSPAAKMEEKPANTESWDAFLETPTAEGKAAASTISVRRVHLKTPRKTLVRRVSQKKPIRTPSIKEPLSTTSKEPSIQQTKTATVPLPNHLPKLNHLRLWTHDDTRTIGFRLTWLSSAILTFLIWYYLENRVHNFIGKPLYATGTQQWNAAGPEWGDAIPTLLDKAFGWPIGEVVRIPKTVLLVWPSQLRIVAKDWMMLGLSELEREAIRKDVPIAALYRSRIADEVVRTDGWDEDEVL